MTSIQLGVLGHAHRQTDTHTLGMWKLAVCLTSLPTWAGLSTFPKCTGEEAL